MQNELFVSSQCIASARRVFCVQCAWSAAVCACVVYSYMYSCRAGRTPRDREQAGTSVESKLDIIRYGETIRSSGLPRRTFRAVRTGSRLTASITRLQLAGAASMSPGMLLKRYSRWTATPSVAVFRWWISSNCHTAPTLALR